MQPGAEMPGGYRPKAGYGPPVATGERAQPPSQPQPDPVQRAVAGAVTSFRKRLIDFSTMTWALRIITLLGFAQLVAIGVVVALRGADQTQLIIDHLNGRAIQVPVAVFVVGLVGLGLVWAILLTAALHSPWYLRFGALLFFTFWALLEDATGFPVGENPAARLNDTVVTILFVQLGILGGIWLRAIAISIVNWRAGSTGISLNRERSIGATFALLLVAMATHYIAGYVASGAANNGPNDLTFTMMISIELGFLFVLLLPVLFVTGTDFAEAGQTISDGVASFLRRGSPVVLYALTLLLALGVTGYYIFVLLNDQSLIEQFDLLGSADRLLQGIVGAGIVLLGYGVVVALLAWGVVRLLELTVAMQRWPALEVPAWGYLVATLVLALGFGVVTLLLAAGLPVIVVVVIPVIGVALGWSLALVGRTRPGPLSATGLFITVSTTIGVEAYAWVYSGLPGLQLLVAPASVVALLWLAVRRGVNPSTAPFVAQLFALDVAVLAVAWFSELFKPGQGTQQVGVIAAVALVGAFFWDLLTSGSRVTNVDGRRFRRYVRVLVYVGYTLFIATVALFFTTETYVGGGVPDLTHALNGEQIARLGLLFLGVPLVVTTFLLRVSRWRAGRLS